MKFIGYTLIALSLTGITTAGLHLFSHLPLVPATPWLDWFGRLPLSAGPFSHHTLILLGTSVLLFAVGLRQVNPKKKSRSHKEGEL